MDVLKTPPELLGASITRLLNQYADDVAEHVDEIAIGMGRRGVNALRKESAADFGGSGRYARGWTMTVQKTRTGTSVIIHNAETPGLPHLLEYGHANRGGGRTPGRQHISFVENIITREFQEEVVGKL